MKLWTKIIQRHLHKKDIYQASDLSGLALFLITAKRVPVKKNNRYWDSHARANSVDPDLTAHRCAVKSGPSGPVRIQKQISPQQKQKGNWLRCYEYTPRGSNLVIFIFASRPNGGQHVHEQDMSQGLNSSPVSALSIT